MLGTRDIQKVTAICLYLKSAILNKVIRLQFIDYFWSYFNYSFVSQLPLHEDTQQISVKIFAPVNFETYHVIWFF